MLSARSIVVGCGLGLLAGCATGPVPVSALPGANKDVASFNRDETACRAEGSRAAYPASGGAAVSFNTNEVWGRFFAQYGRCETAKGNLVQPVPWAVAYGLYLGIGLPYPAPYYAPYPPPPWGAPGPYGYP